MYADDIVLFFTSKKRLQESLDGLYKYCYEWGLNLSTDKTMILIFNKTERRETAEFNFGEQKLDTTQTYKYLGLTLTASSKFGPSKEDLLNRGMKAMFKLTLMFKSAKPSYVMCMHLFDSVIKPVRLYG